MLGIFAEGQVGFCETELLPFKEGAVIFATSSKVPIVPAAIVGSTYLWLGRRVEVRFGDPISTEGARGHAGRADLELRVRAACEALLPDAEPPSRASDRSACWATCSPAPQTWRAVGPSSASSRARLNPGPG